MNRQDFDKWKEKNCIETWVCEELYNFLSKEIEKLHLVELGQMEIISKQKQEIERLKGLLKKEFDFKFCEPHDDEWQQFKTDNQL